MYELKCPACAEGQRVAFARVNAVAACPSCGKKYRIEDRHIRHMIRQAGEATLQPEEVLRARVGLSGLSEVMSREGPAVQPARDGTHAARNAATNTGPTTAQRLAARRQQHARVQRHRLFAGTAIGFLLVGGLLMYVAHTSGWFRQGVNRLATPPDDPDAQALLYDAEPQRAEAWTRLEPAPFVRPAYVTDELFLDSPRVVPTIGGYMLTATVRTEKFSYVDEARATLMIVNGDNEFVARTLVPVSLIHERRPRAIRAVIPEDLWPSDGDYRVEGWVEVTRRLDRPYEVVENIAVEPEPAEDGRIRILISTVHPDQAPPLKRLVFLLTALDRVDRPTDAWRVQITGTIEPGQDLQFYAIVPTREGAPAPEGWRVQAAGDAVTPRLP